MKNLKNQIIFQIHDKAIDIITSQISTKIEKQIYNQLKHSFQNIFNRTADTIYYQAWLMISDQIHDQVSLDL